MENEKKIKKNPLSFQIDPNLFEAASEEEKAVKEVNAFKKAAASELPELKK